MKEEYPRQIPQKIFGVLAVIGILVLVAYAITDFAQNIQVKFGLKRLGMPNVDQITVIHKDTLKKEGTRIKGYNYLLKFRNIDTNSICEGGISEDFDKRMTKELVCTKISK